ncbi:hypothetical protein DGG96_17380 [Legionella qingyii]|uniref:Uncharacterized protein n=1 Tax=Legionella qingyii TaxID=2184757 RepID=A0A317U247_9GAMM|nr:hypothetical protein DGG96_17380 [Legionella qingyii]
MKSGIVKVVHKATFALVRLFITVKLHMLFRSNDFCPDKQKEDRQNGTTKVIEVISGMRCRADEVVLICMRLID